MIQQIAVVVLTRLCGVVTWEFLLSLSKNVLGALRESRESLILQIRVSQYQCNERDLLRFPALHPPGPQAKRQPEQSGCWSAAGHQERGCPRPRAPGARWVGPASASSIVIGTEGHCQLIICKVCVVKIAIRLVKLAAMFVELAK